MPQRRHSGLLSISISIALLVITGAGLVRPVDAQEPPASPPPQDGAPPPDVLPPWETLGPAMPLPKPRPAPSGKLRLALFISGGTALGLSWGAGAISSAFCDGLAAFVTGIASGHPTGLGFCGMGALYAPLVGPWIQLRLMHSSPDTTLPLPPAILVFDGLLQAAGLALIVGGAVSPSHDASSSQTRLTVAPLLLRGGSGILVSGKL